MRAGCKRVHFSFQAMQPSSSMSLFRVLLSSIVLGSAPVHALHRASRADAHHADAAFSAWLPQWFTFGATAWPERPTALTDVLVAPAFFSKAREDEYAYEEMFHLQAEGVYVELSAVDGDFSHSKFFSGSLGW